MKVLDIISETATGEFAEFVFKKFFRNKAQQEFAESLVEQVATDIFKKFTMVTTGPRATGKDVRLAVEEALVGTTYAGDKNFVKELTEEVVKYHDKQLLPHIKKAPKIQTGAAEASAKWASEGLALLNGIFYMYAAYDVSQSLQRYHKNIGRALAALETGEAGKDKDGNPGISLESFEIYHREQLGKLFLSIATVHPAAFSKIPWLGWLAKPFQSLGAGGAGLWLYFTNASASSLGVIPLPGQRPDESLREAIARYSMWQIKDISWLPGTSGESLASVLGKPVKWTVEAAKDLWTAAVRKFYPGNTIPEFLLPTLLPDHSTGKKPNQGGQVKPADADQYDALKPPRAKGDAYYHPSDWEDIGGGYERHKFNSTVAKKLPGSNASKAEVRNPADWRDLGNGYEVNIKKGPKGEPVYGTGDIQLKN